MTRNFGHVNVVLVTETLSVSGMGDTLCKGEINPQLLSLEADTTDLGFIDTLRITAMSFETLHVTLSDTRFSMLLTWDPKERKCILMKYRETFLQLPNGT